MIPDLLAKFWRRRQKGSLGPNNIIEPIAHHFDASKTPTLYHYTSCSGAIGIVANQEFWLSDFSKTNDGSEFIYARDHFIRCYQSRSVFVEETPRFLNTINLINLEHSACMMIGCLTDRVDDFGLWGQYGDQFQGCMIGIDARWLEAEAGVAMRRVNYDLPYLEKFVEAGLMMLQSAYERSPTDLSELDELSKFYLLDLFAFKDERFRFESEVRISRLVSRSTETGELTDIGGQKSCGASTAQLPILKRNGLYGLTEFIKLPLSDGSKSAIRSIRFGPNISTENRMSVLQAVKDFDIEISDSDIPIRRKSADQQ